MTGYRIVPKCRCPFCGRHWRLLPWVAVVVVVGSLLLFGGGRHPVYVDALFAVAVTFCVLSVSQNVIFKVQDRHENPFRGDGWPE
ncbi:hypothetical protein [Streptomyces sp. NPDC127197]|uniref:hypothetical protein n=1 Tax=Streptomyces sp. NPDC127197 TaxID=3345388 RepID=UPI00363D5508